MHTKAAFRLGYGIQKVANPQNMDYVSAFYGLPGTPTEEYDLPQQPVEQTSGRNWWDNWIMDPQPSKPRLSTDPVNPLAPQPLWQSDRPSDQELMDTYNQQQAEWQQRVNNDQSAPGTSMYDTAMNVGGGALGIANDLFNPLAGGVASAVGTYAAAPSMSTWGPKTVASGLQRFGNWAAPGITKSIAGQLGRLAPFAAGAGNYLPSGPGALGNAWNYARSLTPWAGVAPANAFPASGPLATLAAGGRLASLGAGGTAAAAGYGAYSLYDAARTGVDLATGNDNLREYEAGQLNSTPGWRGYLENVGGNLMRPGRAMIDSSHGVWTTPYTYATEAWRRGGLDQQLASPELRRQRLAESMERSGFKPKAENMYNPNMPSFSTPEVPKVPATVEDSVTPVPLVQPAHDAARRRLEAFRNRGNAVAPQPMYMHPSTLPPPPPINVNSNPPASATPNRAVGGFTSGPQGITSPDGVLHAPGSPKYDYHKDTMDQVDALNQRHGSPPTSPVPAPQTKTTTTRSEHFIEPGGTVRTPDGQTHAPGTPEYLKAHAAFDRIGPARQLEMQRRIREMGGEAGRATGKLQGGTTLPYNPAQPSRSTTLPFDPATPAQSQMLTAPQPPAAPPAPKPPAIPKAPQATKPPLTPKLNNPIA